MTVWVGEQIQASTGVWTGNPTSYAYQWQQSTNGTTGWSNVTGATRSDYIVSVLDISLYFRVGVTATNAGGSSTVTYSAAVGPVEIYIAPTPVGPVVLIATPHAPGSRTVTVVTVGSAAAAAAALGSATATGHAGSGIGLSGRVKGTVTLTPLPTTSL